MDAFDAIGLSDASIIRHISFILILIDKQLEITTCLYLALIPRQSPSASSPFLYFIKYCRHQYARAIGLA